jgi:hypothetical protein
MTAAGIRSVVIFVDHMSIIENGTWIGWRPPPWKRAPHSFCRLHTNVTVPQGHLANTLPVNRDYLTRLMAVG